MTVELNHTIVAARDKQQSAAFLAGILGLEVGPPVARFASLALSNSVTLDYMDLAHGPPRGIAKREQAFLPGHYAFLVSDDVFDAALDRIKATGIAFHAEPSGGRPGEIYRSGSGGKGVYFPDPDGHLMELLTADLSGRTAEGSDRPDA
ncbi:MAG TPA: VOC family protein [Acidimicrobiales bacterium]|nr:VOC family protein [Acidimicrobiales bacterium]